MNGEEGGYIPSYLMCDAVLVSENAKELTLVSLHWMRYKPLFLFDYDILDVFIFIENPWAIGTSMLKTILIGWNITGYVIGY